MQLLVERITINEDGVEIEYRTNDIPAVKEAYSEEEFD